eukprot:3801215-Rhodomonas_salina.1
MKEVSCPASLWTPPLFPSFFCEIPPSLDSQESNLQLTHPRREDHHADAHGGRAAERRGPKGTMLPPVPARRNQTHHAACA